MAKLRVVIVDDEPPARLRLRQLLAEAGDVVVLGEAGDGHEARAVIEATRPDVVFLDVDMPEQSGTAVAAALRDPKPFIVFATAFERYAVDAFAVDATDYLLKPITRARLASTLLRVRDRVSRQSDLELEFAAASATQSSMMLRSLPAIAGFDLAAITVPARGVGGDFYLAQPLSDRRIVLALGDVSGKGMPAGLLASSLQARIETAARQGGASAAAIVGDINSNIWSTADTGRFATLVYIDLDADRGQMEIVNAGHLPVIVAHADGTRTLAASTGPALGMVPGAAFATTRLSIAAGSIAVIYSDGITEAMDDRDDEFGEARVAHAIESHRDQAAGDLCQRILDRVRDHRAGAPGVDDATVMVIKACPSAR